MTTETTATLTINRIPNGTWTMVNKVTGEHRTFKISTKPEDSKFAPGERVVALLSGPDNESSYTGFGFVRKTDDGIYVWKTKQGIYGQPSPFDHYARMLTGMFLGDERWTSRYTIEGAKCCLMCNRKLTHPESLETGYGPECATKLGG